MNFSIIVKEIFESELLLPEVLLPEVMNDLNFNSEKINLKRKREDKICKDEICYSNKKQKINKLFECSYSDCKFESPYKCSVKKHISDIHEREFIICKKVGCNYISSNKRTYEEHMKTHGRKIYCRFENCNFKTPNISSYRRHLRNKHFKNKIKKEQKYICQVPKCTKKYTSKYNLKKHIEKYHTD